MGTRSHKSPALFTLYALAFHLLFIYRTDFLSIRTVENRFTSLKEVGDSRLCYNMLSTHHHASSCRCDEPVPARNGDSRNQEEAKYEYLRLREGQVISVASLNASYERREIPMQRV